MKVRLLHRTCTQLENILGSLWVHCEDGVWDLRSNQNWNILMILYDIQDKFLSWYDSVFTINIQYHFWASQRRSNDVLA